MLLKNQDILSITVYMYCDQRVTNPPEKSGGEIKQVSNLYKVAYK